MTTPKLFRDPVHDIITLDVDDPCERLVFALVQTPEVQRLRHIRQLGLANLVYHGAEHSRFAHSMGVVHIASRMLARVQTSLHVSTEDRFTTLAAALLHDIGHGPFSHAFEPIVGLHHEARTRAFILDPDSGVHRTLADVDPSLPERVAALLHPRHLRSFCSDIVSSQLDADRLDYILRDGLSTGVRIGVYDLERILSMLRADPQHLVVNARAKEAVEGYLLARFHMFKQVYLHKVVRAAEHMLKAVLRRASALLLDGRDVPVPSPTFARLLRGLPLDVAHYTQLDDADVWNALKAWTQHPDPALRALSHGIRNRAIYKTLPLADAPPERAKDAVEAARRAVVQLGGDPDVHLLVDRASDTPYKPYVPDADPHDEQRPIILEGHSRLYRIEDLSDVAHLLGRDRYSTVRLCFPDPMRVPITRAVEEALGTDFRVRLRRPTGPQRAIPRPPASTTPDTPDANT